MSTAQCEGSAAEQGRSMVQERTGRGGSVRMPRLPKTLTADEKKYLLAVERGDNATVKRLIQRSKGENGIDPNCLDPLGRGALLMAIEGEQLSMVELLVVMGVKTADSLLHAIDKEFVEAVELLLEHEELIHKEGEPYSWENIDRDTATFTPEITPLILAAHRNNYEILKILLDRGAQIPMPHDIRCACEECISGVRQDCLRHSASRINSYKALASPSLIALTSTDPLLTSFELSWELKQLSFSENEFRADYMELRRKSQDFAVALLSHTRTSHELQVMLNFDPHIMKDEDSESVEDLVPAEIHECGLSRLRLAIKYKQKKFVAHPWVQQLLAAIWYEGLPGFRQRTAVGKGVEIAKIITTFPFFCLWYMLAPKSSTGKLLRKPFMKFLIHASSYLFFLLLLILVSQRVEELIVQWFEQRSHDVDNDGIIDPTYKMKHRGNPPRFLELFVFIYVLGFIWEEVRELWRSGFAAYVGNLWNAIDFLRNSLYIIVAILRTWAYMVQRQEISEDPRKAYIAREDWDDFDPQLIAEGLFAAANIFSALKLVHTSSINPYLGPLQISLGRMVVDILKFFFFYSLVLFAFACGLNQLLWYFADLERSKCYCLPGGLPDWNKNAEACMKWRRFGNLFESSQSLFWASFGMVSLADFELTGIKSYTRFWGLLMFGSYSVINVIVLLNLLIAMMSSSYAAITEKADTEWKFARTKLWLSYFDEDSTLPSPFNLCPTPKQLKRLLARFIPKTSKGGNSEKDRESRHSELREQAREYTAVMRALVWRYVSGMQRKAEETAVTEDDINEVKGEISTLRFDLVEMFRRNGMNVSSLVNRPAALTKKTREWERRLFRGFHVAPAAGEDNIMLNFDDPDNDGQGDDSEDKGADRFRKMARLALLNRERLARPPKHLSHIGRSTSSDSLKGRQLLKTAMEEAKQATSTIPEKGSPSPSKLSTESCDGNHVIPQRSGNLLTMFKESAKGNLMSKLTAAEEKPISPLATLSAENLLKEQDQKTEDTSFLLNTVQECPVDSSPDQKDSLILTSTDEGSSSDTVSKSLEKKRSTEGATIISLESETEQRRSLDENLLVTENITPNSSQTEILMETEKPVTPDFQINILDETATTDSAGEATEATFNEFSTFANNGDDSDEHPLINMNSPEKESQTKGTLTTAAAPSFSSGLTVTDLPIVGSRVEDVKTIKRPSSNMWF